MSEREGEEWKVAQEGSGWGRRRARTTIVTPPSSSSTRSKPPTPLISKEGGERKKNWISTRLQQSALLCALLFPPLQPDHLYLFFLLSLLSLSPLRHPLLSPFTAGLGYSFRCQAHSVSLLLRVTERQRERGERESEKKRGRGGGRKKKWEKYEKRQATAMQGKRKEGGK